MELELVKYGNFDDGDQCQYGGNCLYMGDYFWIDNVQQDEDLQYYDVGDG